MEGPTETRGHVQKEGSLADVSHAFGHGQELSRMEKKRRVDRDSSLQKERVEDEALFRKQSDGKEMEAGNN